MRRTPFNDGWTVGAEGQLLHGDDRRIGVGAGAGDLAPRRHDRQRSGRPPGTAATAYFPSGSWEYTKSFEPSPDDEGSALFLEFEGVYRDARVRVNDTLVAHRPGGYSGFTVQVDHLLRFGEPNEVKVEARAHDDSRWYSGGGIYRSVWLLQGGRVHLVPGGLQVATPEIDDDVAVVAVSAEVRNQSIGDLERACCGWRCSTRTATFVAGAEAPVTTVPGDVLTARQRLCVPTPHRWGPDDPYLYTCRATLLDGERVLDEESTTFGIRSLTVDPVRGLRINGEPVLLRGACVHHDNGPLGAATIGRAEERRVELLKEAGLQRHQERAQPLEQADARRLRPPRGARHGRDLRHVDAAEERARLRPALPRLVGGGRGGHGPQGLQPPERDPLQHRQRDPRGGDAHGRPRRACAGGEDPVARRHQVRHRGHQRPAGRRLRALRPARRERRQEQPRSRTRRRA